MKIGIVGQKWLAETLFKALSAEFDICFVAAPRAQDRLWIAATAAGLAPANYLGGGLDKCPLPEPLDLLITAHAFVHIPARLRSSARWSIGYHPSLLPLHRGRHAVEEAINDGDRITGGTVYHLEDDYDAGPVAFFDWCMINPDETAEGLWRRSLAPMGVGLLVQAARTLKSRGSLPSAPQKVF